jgi:hypothetical protein
MRSLKRRLCDVIYRQTLRDQARADALHQPQPQPSRTLITAAA